MKTQIEIIDHAMTMLQAFKDGKKLTYLPSPGKPQSVAGAAHLISVIDCEYEITIAPEPLECFVTSYLGDNSVRVPSTMQHPSEEAAKEFARRFFGDSAKVHRMREVLP